MLRLSDQIKFKVLTNVGTFFYDKFRNETHFFPLDSAEFFTLLTNGCESNDLLKALLTEFDLDDAECIKIVEDAVVSLKSSNIISEI